MTPIKDQQENRMIKKDDPQEEFEQAIIATLDLNTWTSGENLLELYARLKTEQEVRDAIADEERIRHQIRNEVFPRITAGKKSVPSSGFHRFSVEMLEKAHRGLLFNGGVEGCDGIVLVHDTLPLTITQIGICLTSYQGEQGSYAHRLYRRDFKLRGEDPVQEALEALEQRKNRGGFDSEEGVDNLSHLARRGVMAYAERAILLEKSKAKWRMGHGHPTPYELFSGHWALRKELTEAALTMMRRLVLEHQRFVFVPRSRGRRELLTLGNALGPLEYLILVPIKDYLINRINKGGARKPMSSMMLDFAEEVGSEIVVGLYRVSRACPPYLFYAHKDHVQTAALIAMADSSLQEHRGFPMLIDIADNLCRTTFGVDGFISSVQEAYADAGQPFRYLTERETRI